MPGEDRSAARPVADVCGALFLDGLDTSMPSVALPSIGSALDLEAGGLQWTVSGQVLTFSPTRKR